MREYAAKLHSKEVAGYAMRASKSGGCAGWMVPMLLRAWGGGVVKDYPNDWRGNLTSPESIAALGIPANSPEKELGSKFIEWVLSEHVQRRNKVENKSSTITRPKISVSQLPARSSSPLRRTSFRLSCADTCAPACWAALSRAEWQRFGWER